MAKKAKKPQEKMIPTPPVERSESLRNAEANMYGEMPEEDQQILIEAYERFDYCSSWEADFRPKFIEDVKFANGDSDNGWQWPDDLRSARMLARRPALTINKVQNHVNLVVNDSRQNKAGIVVKPAGSETSFQAAQGLEALIRNIEYQSTATSIYDEMAQNQVEGGIAYGRVTTIFPDPRTFDQELRIVPVQNHLNVYIDPDIKQKSGADADYGFIFEDITKAEYKREHKKDAPYSSSPLGEGVGSDWVKDDHIRQCEYYRIARRKDELIYFKQGDKESLFLRSEIPQGMKRAFRLAQEAFDRGDAGTEIEIKTRPTEIKRLQWFKICGREILDREEYQTQYVPIFRFVGRERVIEGKLERKGLVRSMKDAQRMYNYNSSAEAEAAALSTKTNWLAAIESIQGNETAWNRSNVDNKAVLTYRHKDRDGDPIPPPQRIDPAKSAEAYLAGMEIASRELEMASGQGAAQFGKPTQERTGKALTENRRQGDILTFDFIDNQALGIQYLGMILLDWIPFCYVTKQVVQILDKDGTERQLIIDPAAESPYEEKKTMDKVEAVLNPKVGRYKVQAQPGPAYATQRQEAWNAFVQIVTGAPDLINEIGDLMFLSADFPMADEIAQRLRRKIKQLAPYLLDEGAKNPQVAALEQQLQQAGQQLSELLQQLAERDRALKDKSEKLGIDAARASNEYRKTDIAEKDSISKRVTAISNAQLDLDRAGEGDALRVLIRTMIRDVLKDEGSSDLDNRMPIPDDQGAGDEVPMPGVNASEQDDGADFLEPKQAQDGHHYVRKGGQYFKVDVGALNAQPT